MTAAASGWDGRSRAPLRVALATVVLFDVGLVALFVARNPPDARSRSLAPSWLIALGGHPLRTACVALVAAVALVSFARGRAIVSSAFVALASLAVLNESLAALVGGPMRFLYFGGACLLGWTVGYAASRAATQVGVPARDERVAERTTLAVLAAAYVNAAVSKIGESGFHWFEPRHLQFVVLGHHNFADESWVGRFAHLVVGSDTLAAALSGATLVIQLGAPLLLVGMRSRFAWSLLLLGFHLNVLLLAHILFLQSMLLLVAFCWPWGRWLSRWVPARDDGSASEPVSPAPRERGVLRVSAAIVAVAVVAAWTLPIRGYTRSHHVGERPSVHARTPERAPPAPWADPRIPRSRVTEPSASLRAPLGNLAAGDEIAGYRVLGVGVLRDERTVVVALARGDVRWTIRLTARGARSESAPRSTDRWDVFYDRAWSGDLSPSDRDRVLDEFAARARANAMGAPVTF